MRDEVQKEMTNPTYLWFDRMLTPLNHVDEVQHSTVSRPRLTKTYWRPQKLAYKDQSPAAKAHLELQLSRGGKAARECKPSAAARRVGTSQHGLFGTGAQERCQSGS